MATMIAHGMRMPPVPRIGRMSKIATQKPIKIAFGICSSEKPTASSMKVIEKISE